MTPGAILAILGALIAIFLAFRYDVKKKKRDVVRKAEYDAALLSKQTAYQEAIQNGNKQLALKLGREYYSFMRGGSLSIYDEQALSNDLATMNQ